MKPVRPALLLSLLIALATLALQSPASSSPQPVPDEAAVVAEMNSARTNPAAYARHLQELLGYFDGKVIRKPGKVGLRTQEGKPAVIEAIAFLRRTAPVPALKSSPALAAAARDHVRDQGPTGATGHDGSDGSTMSSRIGRHGRWMGSISENIDYGADTAREVMISLIVDDGVPGRGHRTNIFKRGTRFTGVACGSHLRYGSMCVIDYASEIQVFRSR